MRAAPKSPTPAQLAQYGHIAGLLRQKLSERKWRAPELSEAIGQSRAYAPVYHWLKGTSAPGPTARAKLAALLSVSEEELTPHKEASPRGRRPPTGIPAEAMPMLPPARKPGETLSFTIDDQGQARIKLDVTMPLEQAKPLLRLLLDAEAIGRGENVG